MGRALFPRVDEEREIGQALEQMNVDYALRERSTISPAEKPWWEVKSTAALSAKTAGSPVAPVVNLPVLREQLAKSSSPETKNAAARALGTAWGALNPLEAIQWFGGLTEPADQASAAAGIAKGWSLSEPISCSEWVASLQDGPVREAAVGEFSRNSAKFLPKLALSFALSIDTPSARTPAADAALQGAALDEETTAQAKEVINESGLSKNEKADYLERLETYRSGIPANP